MCTRHNLFIVLVHYILLTSHLFKTLSEDLRRRKKTYISDWTDAFDNKRAVVPAILFLYFACLAPVVSFGTIATQITEGSIGVVEFLIASGGAGMVSVSVDFKLFLSTTILFTLLFP